ncbi:effector binding domain-containing protein [Vagococcus entomophilus]|uniref:Integron-associated effector binding protein domain-containing protein n=1 Tax=Vagococcus entomophilus TaxID=1160095 RepID=A0A430AGL5_9ENTE|nr:effector binding domain-containing protein [Vagococcus entomophilus]RSU06987.1 hypothetical protein CBF30_06920 [Vagococcus entomophilus]
MDVYALNHTRTNNFALDMPDKIGQAWQEAKQKVGEVQTIQYGIYHEYDGNYQKDYTLTIASEKEVEGAQLMLLADDFYQVFPVDTRQKMGIFQTWQQIWNLEEEGKLKRAYTQDYEKYYLDGRVEIYIAL